MPTGRKNYCPHFMLQSSSTLSIQHTATDYTIGRMIFERIGKNVLVEFILLIFERNIMIPHSNEIRKCIFRDFTLVQNKLTANFQCLT